MPTPPPTHPHPPDTETETHWLAHLTNEIQEAHRLLDHHIPRRDQRGTYTLAERVALLVDLLGTPPHPGGNHP